MQKVLITGSQGIIGTILRNGLKEYNLSVADLPETDLRDYGQTLEVVRGNAAVIHLAWASSDRPWQQRDMPDTDNARMFSNVYKAAHESGVKRVVMASSVHADDYRSRDEDLLTADEIIGPDSAYGASKVFMESLGRYYARRGLEVICVRLGGVNPDNKTDYPGEDDYHRVWLSHKDCVALFRACLDAESVPGNFVVFYGVSDNTGRYHDWQNPFGWTPADDSAKETL